MKINQKLQSQILPLLNSQVSDTISTQREAFNEKLQGSLEVLENIEENLVDLSPVEVEIALDQMCEQLKSVMDTFQSEIASICGSEGALSLVRKIRGMSTEEANMLKEYKAEKKAVRTALHHQRLAERAERVAAKKAAQEAKAAAAAAEAAAAAKPKKTVKKLPRRSK